MDLILAVDVKAGQVVHGSSGKRDTYRPLTWGLSPTADPVGYVHALSPRNLYIADLDSIMMSGDNTAQAIACSALVDRCYLDRGCRSPADYLCEPGIIDIAGTETTYSDLSEYPGGYVSLDIRNGCVIPSGEEPRDLLRLASDWLFEGAILLNLGAVGTGAGISSLSFEGLRDVYEKPLLYGGGVATPADLDRLSALGFDGAIVATAIHSGAIPMENLRRGIWC